MMKAKNKNNIVNKYKVIYLPLLIGVIAILTVSMVSYTISKRLLLEQMKEDGLNLAHFTASKINNEVETLDMLNMLIENKISIVGKIVMYAQEYINNDMLNNITRDTEVDVINWYSPDGKIVYSSNENHIGLEDYLEVDIVFNENNEFVEKISNDLIKNNDYLYGYFKDDQNNVIQVGLKTDETYKTVKAFNYQAIVENLAKEESIEYALIVDKQLKTIADSDHEDIAIIYTDDEEYLSVLNGNVATYIWYYDKKNSDVLEVAVPLVIHDEIVGIVAIGLSLKNVFKYIFIIFISLFIITTIMVFIFILVQNNNVIKPIKRINEDINKINIKRNVGYRLPISENGKDTFWGITNSVNNILTEIDSYFTKLSESREELRLKYKEIQDYTEKLEVLKQKYDIAIKGTNSAIWEINLMHDTFESSENMMNISEEFGANSNNNVYYIIENFVHPEDKEMVLSEYQQCKSGMKEEININIRTVVDGNLNWYLLRGKGIYDKDKKLISVNGIFHDITNLKEQEAYIEKFAYYDPLTNLPNRRLFNEKLKANLELNHTGAVVLLDLDNFKGINDTLGHMYGDGVLKRIADELMHLRYENVLVSRFGGDEFLVLIVEEDIEKIKTYVANLYEQFSNSKMIIDDHEIYISFSIGVTLFPEDSDNVNQLIMNADMAMYEAKNSGKNNYKFFHTDILNNINEKITIENILRDALKDKEFKLLYQPLVSTKSGEIIGFEALLRLNKHNISPALFIPAAEETGMIIKIGRWVTEEVITQLALWMKKGYNLKPISINFSAKQLNDFNYAKFLEEKLNEYKIDAKYLEIEITENLFLENKDKTINFLNQLKSLGVNIAIDDFGTGYSSLNYLTFLPVDKIKLDKSLSDKYLETKNVKVIEGIIALAHSLDLEVVAEGIEEIEQYNQLVSIGCNYIQGYLFSKPIEIEQVEIDYNKVF